MTEIEAATQPTGAATINLHVNTDLLTRGRIVIVGLGGVGLILSTYLVLFISSLKQKFRVLVCDGDAYEEGNNYRMDVPGYGNKALVAAGDLNDRFGRPGLLIRPEPNYLTAQNRDEVIQEGDCVLLCVDNHASRKLASDRACELDNVVLISGGNDGLGEGERGTYGNIQVYVRENGNEVAGVPLDRFHPEIANPQDKNPDDLDCIELEKNGVAQLLPVNLAIGSCMLSALLRLLMPPKDEEMYDEVCLDVLDATMLPNWLTGNRKHSPERRP